MKSLKFYYSFILSLALYFMLVAFTRATSEEEPVANNKVIKFSHKDHVENVTCGECHSSVPQSVSLQDPLLPKKENCSECHDVEDDNNCETCHYDDNYEALVQKKSRLIFNHKFHLEENNDCEKCHSGLQDVNYAFESDSASPAMNICYECHNNNSVAANNCESCHISTVNLLPQDHKTATFFENHKFKATGNNDCQMCHDENFCETCHASTTGMTETNTKDDFYSPFAPHDFVDNAKQQQISRVHDLNYRFTHGIEAKGKTSECITCHQTETFCAECHNVSGGDFALEGFLPSSHKASNFTTFGVGSGGGEHARLAKRDIESCAACHDTQGADPNCILCHTDADGIKGTNPKTHERGFLKNVKGDWHDDKGAICFDCHTDPAALAGQENNGFCGYCHK